MIFLGAEDLASRRKQNGNIRRGPLPSPDDISKGIHLLGDMLGEMLVEQECTKFFKLEGDQDQSFFR